MNKKFSAVVGTTIRLDTDVRADLAEVTDKIQYGYTQAEIVEMGIKEAKRKGPKKK